MDRPGLTRPCAPNPYGVPVACRGAPPSLRATRSDALSGSRADRPAPVSWLSTASVGGGEPPAVLVKAVAHRIASVQREPGHDRRRGQGRVQVHRELARGRHDGADPSPRLARREDGKDPACGRKPCGGHDNRRVSRSHALAPGSVREPDLAVDPEAELRGRRRPPVQADRARRVVGVARDAATAVPPPRTSPTRTRPCRRCRPTRQRRTSSCRRQPATNRTPRCGSCSRIEAVRRGHAPPVDAGATSARSLSPNPAPSPMALPANAVVPIAVVVMLVVEPVTLSTSLTTSLGSAAATIAGIAADAASARRHRPPQPGLPGATAAPLRWCPCPLPPSAQKTPARSAHCAPLRDAQADESPSIATSMASSATRTDRRDLRGLWIAAQVVRT